MGLLAPLHYRSIPHAVVILCRGRAAVHELNPEDEELPQGVDACSVNLFLRSISDPDVSNPVKPSRRIGAVAYLCAVFVVVPKKGVRLSQVEEAAAAILPPSLIVRSAKDFALLWILEPGLSVSKAVDRKRYNDVQRQLANLLSSALKVTAQRKAANDVVMLPGKNVRWVEFAGKPTYSLEALYEAAFGRPFPRKRARRKRKSVAKDPKKKEQFYELHEKRVNRIYELGKLRRGFQGEHRFNAAKIMGFSLKRLYSCLLSRDIAAQIEADIRGLNDSYFVPTLKERSIKKILAEVLEPRASTAEYIRDEQIGNDLDITFAEEKRIGWPRAARFKTKAQLMPPKSPRELATLKRREAIRRMLADGKPRSVRQVVKELARLRISASPATVSRDMRQLHLGLA